MLIAICIIIVLTQFGSLLLSYFLILRPSQKRDYDALLSKYNELEGEHAQALRNIEALKEENRDLRDENRWLRGEKDRLERQVDTLKVWLTTALASIPGVIVVVIMVMQYTQG